MSVLVEVARSAEPPIRWGTLAAAHWIAFSEALRVAIGSSPGQKRGRPSSHPSGSRAGVDHLELAAFSG